jgi:hypothetical protein
LTARLAAELTGSGLPDGLFSKIPIWVNFGLASVDIFFGHLEYFIEIWDIL